MKNFGFGFRGLPFVEVEGRKKADIEQVKQMVDVFIARGYTYFDTAYNYMEFRSELVLKEALSMRYPREDFLLADKLPLSLLRKDGDQEHIFEEQLRKCGVAYFDYYLLHDLNTETLDIAEKFDSFSFLSKVKEQGKAKHIGFSFHGTPELLEKILTAHPELDMVQLQLNYIDWNNTCIRSRECYEIARAHHMDIVVMEPIKGGTLARIPHEAVTEFQKIHPDWSSASWAIRYAASKEGVIAVLTGMSDLFQLVDNTENMREFQPLGWVEEAVVDRAREIIESYNVANCVNCGACVQNCVKNLPIAQYIALYNAEQQSNHSTYNIHKMYYKDLNTQYNKASTCIGCKQCENACPNRVTIADLMKRVASTFES